MSEQSVQAPPSPWILGPSRDLLLFVGTPILIVPIVMLLLFSFESAQIRFTVLAFGAMGHNLPGMIRAYGDRALFERFRLRFILAPVVIGAICFASALSRPDAIMPIVFFWAAWHALMQVYGFMRIYDAKVGAFAPRISRVDLAMVIAWFGGAMVLSDERVYEIQQTLFNLGIAPLTVGGVQGLRIGVAAIIGVVTITYFATQVFARGGTRPSPVKHLLMFTSIGFWWYAHFLTNDVLLGLVMFEVFHDVQYLAIVWIFNRRRADTDPQAGGVTRFLFRNSWGMIGIYLGLVLAYGGIIPATHGVQPGATGIQILTGVVLTSALLHYYFDGFIWKVRETSTRKALGVTDEGRADRRVPTHALKWLLLLVPFGVFWFTADRERAPGLEKAEALAASTPESAEALYQLGHELNVAGQPLRSLPHLEKSLRILPDNPEAKRSLGLAQLEGARRLWRTEQRARAESLATQSIANIPEIAVLDSRKKGLQAFQANELDKATLLLEVLAHMTPNSRDAHFDLAVVYRAANQRESALRHARRAAELDPGASEIEKLVRSLEER